MRSLVATYGTICEQMFIIFKYRLSQFFAYLLFSFLIGTVSIVCTFERLFCNGTIIMVKYVGL